MALALMSPWLRLKVNGIEHETPEAVEAANFSGQGSFSAACLAEIHYRFNTIIFSSKV